MFKPKTLLSGVIIFGAVACALFSPTPARSQDQLQEEAGDSPGASCATMAGNTCMIVSTPFGDKSWPGVIKIKGN